MTDIQSFIRQEIMAPRLSKRGVLVVYDPQQRYRELCQALEDERTAVVDATESSIIAREQASAALLKVGRGALDRLLIYVPASSSWGNDEACQKDPFAVYAACGAVFPQGDSDSFESLCLRAKPDHGADIRRIFAEDRNPSFAVINAIGGGIGWPNLRALLKVESARDILQALLAPSDAQRNALQAGDTWVAEARDLLSSALGLTLKTKGKTWSTISDELWRFGGADESGGDCDCFAGGLRKPPDDAWRSDMSPQRFIQNRQAGAQRLRMRHASKMRGGRT